MGVVTCMVSAKGGTGKTVLTATFAAILADLGKKVLIVDVDASTNGLSLLYLEELVANRRNSNSDTDSPPRGFFQYGGMQPRDMTRLPTGAWLLPATYDFVDTEHADPDRIRMDLIHFVNKLRNTYDYVFLDAQAGADTFARMVMDREVSDQVVIVSEFDPMSSAGVERLKALQPEDLGFSRTWILLNKMLPEFVESFSEFLEVARYLRPVPWNADVVLAYARRGLALDLEIGNSFTVSVIGSMKPLLTQADVDLLETSLKKRAARLREPIEVQVNDLRRELDHLDHLDHLKKRSDIAEPTFMLLLTLVSFTLAGLVAYAGGFRLKTTGVGLIVASIVVAGVLGAVLARALGVAREIKRRATDGEMIYGRRGLISDELTSLNELRIMDADKLLSSDSVNFLREQMKEKPRNDVPDDAEHAIHRADERDYIESIVREPVARALFEMAVARRDQNQLEAAVAAYDEIVERFGKDTEPGMREQVAMALVNKGVVLGQQNDFEAAIAAYDEVVARFGEDTEQAICEQVAKALVSKGFVLGQQNNPEAAIAAYDEVVARFGEDTEQALSEHVAWALVNKGVALGQQNNPEAAIAAYDEVVERFGEDAISDDLIYVVAKARRFMRELDQRD